LKTCSLLIATYNWPEALRLCLMSVRQQKLLPDEVIIADDGSSAETLELIKEFQKDFPVEIKHIWHEDTGFRLAAIRNKGIASAESDYIIQIDGDLILHPQFVADHLKLRKPGYFVTGSRVLLSPLSTTMLINHKSIDVKKWNLHKRNFMNGVRSRLLSRIMAKRYKTKGKHYFYVKGCNMAFWKSDLVKVNGYNESFTGWGREDSEIAIRLMNTGIRKQFIKMGGVCFHLHHPVASRELEAKNVSMMEEAIEKKLIEAPDGLSKYFAMSLGR
jgi:glycosyltransferase involved in cell wall biosynthesis